MERVSPPFQFTVVKKLIGRVKKRYFVKMSRKVGKLFRNR